ncbi:MoaF C-terminal domain-containing protein [Paenarthrobacter aurescens]|uniref:Molybdenum cofactor biosynthesis protein F n=1 Tax=Paenarthrobacter aurescens TaxID=43663 RepID=A0A4Y3NG97_PAEAU|nr:MoaF C-terminal domain-containing protein [Paenarthrobacter aurescens]MDO6145136.1 molybdenum cofactor biosynthesis F family protein [Paenarthrobacter aurescens]MDO6148981.1 molybdenum cofactor biosynthesis F family protein [Paenarthrobacter aurescens]MDO6160227.1 molybdenum cofactor biosynthesis F family protein [Paenarthrobacter aurescens]MDO6164086.1 molybdenum cofactor biosynthesis F family protein [Paenarthrobacter aurescens]GEB20283.1 molybdenum cofactor biosynthesis protein F [Paenar
MTTTELQDYVPEEEWPPVSTMLDGFGDQTLPASPALAATKIALVATDGTPVEYSFLTSSELAWAEGTATGTAHYKAIEARPGIFIIDFVRGQGDGKDADAQNVTIILDQTTGAVTTAVSGFVVSDGKVRGTTHFTHSNASGQATVHQRSADLVGKRIFYRYSDVESYEHIYLNQGTFTWHCVRGGEAGLADTDRCMTWAVAEDLYIFFWTEQVMTVEAVLLIDLREQRSIGRMFGWDNPAAQPVTLPFNSRLTVLNATSYPQDTHKH